MHEVVRRRGSMRAALAFLGLAAYQQREDAGLLQALPHTSNTDLLLSVLLSRDAVAFATGNPNPRDYRLTNEALLGTLVDDNSESIPALQASVGTYDGGPVVEKDFPAPSSIGDLPVVGQEIAWARPTPRDRWITSASRSRRPTAR